MSRALYHNYALDIAPCEILYIRIFNKDACHDNLRTRFTRRRRGARHLEAIRWPDGPFCPHCGNSDPETITALNGKSHRAGLYECNDCRETSRLRLAVSWNAAISPSKWVLGFHLMAASKKGVSAHQLMRKLGLG